MRFPDRPCGGYLASVAFPSVMIELLMSLHESMLAEVMTNGISTPLIQVNNCCNCTDAV